MTAMADAMLSDIIYFDWLEQMPLMLGISSFPDLLKSSQAAREIHVRRAARQMRQGRTWRSIAKATAVSEQTLSDLQLWVRLYPGELI